MRIGLSVCSNYPGVAPRDGARNMVERTAAAHSADLDSLFVGDHHITPTPYFQNTPILARMLAQWGPKPVGALYLLPLWHPVLLAEQVATLASIAEGKFILQCALGGDARQSAGMGVDLRQRVAMFESSLATVRRLWAGEAVSLAAPWNISEARISPLPPESIDVWVGAQAANAIRRTARLAEGWLASPGLTPSQAANDLGHYNQACAEFERQPTAVAIRRDIYVGADPSEARAAVRESIEQGYRGFAPEALMVGSAEEVAAQISAFAAMGYTDIIVRNICQEQSKALACIERLGEVKALL